MNKLLKYSKFIKFYYQRIIIFTVIIALLLGIYSPAPGQWLIEFSGLLMFLMIYFMSTTIQIKDFIIVGKQPVGILVGIGLNFIIMPLICLALAKIFIQIIYF